MRQTIGEDALVLYSDLAYKFNRWGFQQERVLAVTQHDFLTFEKTEHRYNLRRRIPLQEIQAVVTCAVMSTEVLVVPDASYSEHLNLQTVQRKSAFTSALETVLVGKGIPFSYFFVPEVKLAKYHTTKRDASNGLFKRPPNIYKVSREQK